MAAIPLKSMFKFQLKVQVHLKWNEMKWNGTILTEPFKFFVVDTRRWNIRAGSVSFSLSDDSSMAAVAAAMACVTSFGSGDGVRDEDEPMDGIDNGDLLLAIMSFRMCALMFCQLFDWSIFLVLVTLLLNSLSHFCNLYAAQNLLLWIHKRTKYGVVQRIA